MYSKGKILSIYHVAICSAQHGTLDVAMFYWA